MSQLDPPLIILCVPGPCMDAKELVESVARHSEGYLYAGQILHHIATGASFQLVMEEKSEDLAEAFELASSGRLKEEELKSVADHACCLYLLAEGGSIDSAKSAMAAASALLKCGGAGVKVESAGTAHSKEAWLSLCESDDYLVPQMIGLSNDGQILRSHGMHAFGLPDVQTAYAVESEASADALYGLLHYMVHESPQLQAGQTFSLSSEEPSFGLSHLPDQAEEEDDPFFNPYGLWDMRPL